LRHDPTRRYFYAGGVRMFPAKLGVLVAVVVSVTACHSMRPIALEELEAVKPSRAWVTRTDQSVVIVHGPQLLDNRLAGFIDGKYQVMPAANVQSLQVRQSAPGKTAALVAAGAMGVAAAVVAISGSGGSTGPCTAASSDCEM
jgi:hypothetical protein